MKVEPGNILKLFLNFSNFEPQYSYRLYSYKKKSVLRDFFELPQIPIKSWRGRGNFIQSLIAFEQKTVRGVVYC